MQEVAERLASARDARDVGNVVGDLLQRGLPFGTYGFIVFSPSPAEQPSVVIRSSEFPTDWLAKRFPEILAAMERDLVGGIEAGLRVPRAYDGYVKYPLPTLEHTELLVDHWRPIRCDQQLVAPLWHQSAPIGYFAVVRSRKERRFMPTDLRFVEDLRVHAERSLDAITCLTSGELTQTLDVLSQSFPYPAFLFDTRGRLRWMSDEAAVRLGIVAARIGGRRLIHNNSALEALSACAAAIARDPSATREPALRDAGILRAGERLVVRRFAEHGTPLSLLALTPAMASLPCDPSAKRGSASLPGLGVVESKVARLAAEGYTVLNIAAQLAVSEATVRTHLHRIYVKLGVHGRAELAYALLQGAR